MKSQVYFISVSQDEHLEVTGKKALRLFRKAGLGDCVSKNDITAVKMHFGEDKNNTHIHPMLVKPIVNEIRMLNAKPFLTDTCVLYKSRRDNAVDHLHVAHEHGFTVDKVGAPVVIADGLLGSSEREVPVPGKIFDTVSLSTLTGECNSMIVLSHVTGHLATGMGACLKNLGMGLASRRGKLRQHSVMTPQVNSKKCTGCQVCLKWCPADAIAMNGDTALIDEGACIGCGECLTVCRFDAIKYDWNVDAAELQKRVAEHALGAVIEKPGKVGYMNFLINMTKDCDCFDVRQTPIINDIGLLASLDPVALDKASLDLVRQTEGKDIAGLAYPKVDPMEQVAHAQAIGLGQMEYDLIRLD